MFSHSTHSPTKVNRLSSSYFGYDILVTGSCLFLVAVIGIWIEYSFLRNSLSHTSLAQKQNERLATEIQNQKIELQLLTANKDQIAALWTRLNESMVEPPSAHPSSLSKKYHKEFKKDAPPLYTNGDSDSDFHTTTNPKVGNTIHLPSQLEFWKDAGCQVESVGSHANESIFQISTDHLEWHRLLPLLTTFENSYALENIESLHVSLPDTTEPMGNKPTYLQWEFFVRMPIRGVNVPRPSQIKDLQLPPIYILKYNLTPRDPFVSPKLTNTLISPIVSNDSQLVLNNAIKGIIEPMLNLIQTQCKVSGVSIPTNGAAPYAIINNHAFVSGSKIPLPIEGSVLKQILDTAALYNIPIEANQEATSSTLLLEVSKISRRGIELRIPGFRNSLTELIYQKNFTVDSPSFDFPKAPKK